MTRLTGLLTLLLAVGLLTHLASAENKEKEAAELIQHAKQLSDIRAQGAAPFQLKSRVKLITDDGSPSEGEYTEDWASPEMWRTEIAAGVFHQIETAKDRQLWVLSTAPLLTDFISPRITAAREHLMAFHLDGNWLLPESWKPSKIEDRASASWSLRCVDVNNPFGWKSDLCFDRTSGVVVAQSSTAKDAPYACTYTDYRKFEEKLFPVSIQCFRSGKLALQASVERLIHQAPSQSLFEPPAGGRELSYCPSEGRPARVQSAEVMSFALPAPVVISFILGADAKPRNMTVVLSGGDSVDKSAMAHLVRWGFRPATCEGKPVDSEMQINFPSNLAAHGPDMGVHP